MSPIETYLGQAWIFLLSGDAYLGWPGNTSEEPITKEMATLEETWARLVFSDISLPYDFAEFDQQFLRPRMWQPSRSARMCVLVAMLCPTNEKTGTMVTYAVKGGLMSGLRSTSHESSGWNALFGEFAHKLTS